MSVASSTSALIISALATIAATSETEVTLRTLEKAGAVIDRLRVGRELRILGVDLRRCALATDLVFLRDCPHLETLNLSGTVFGEAELSELRHCRNLRGLDLSGTRAADHTMRDVGLLAELQDLRLNGTAVSDVGVTRLAGLRRVEELEIRDTRITDEGLQSVARWETVRRLVLGGNRIRGHGVNALASLPRLTMLDLSKCALDPRELARVAWPRSMLQLDLAGNADLDDGMLATLAACPKLEALDVSDTAITSAGCALLTPASSLKRLVLAGTAVDDSCVDSLAGIATLRFVDFRETALGWDAATDLMRRVRSLRIVIPDHWPDDRREAFAEEFPGLNICGCGPSANVTGVAGMHWWETLRESRRRFK